MTATEQNETKGVVNERGTSFPYLSLPEAVKIIRDAGSYGRQHSRAAMASYAGHTTANSGPFKQKLAALKEWGFVTTAESQVSLTEAAMNIAYPNSPDSVIAVLLNAFRDCDIFWKIYSDTAKGIPLKPELLANNAVTTYRIGVIAKNKFIKSFVESAEAIGLAQRMPNGELKLLPSTESMETKGRDENLEPLGPEHKSPSVPRKLELHPVVNQVWNSNQAVVIFEVRANGPLSAAAFTEIGKTVTAIEELWTTLAASQTKNDETSDAIH